MDKAIKGRAWIFGDDVDTDALAPGRFMHRPFEELARHCLIDLSPDFAAEAGRGDVLIAGRNFGVGSSREQAAQALKGRGLAGVIAKSFAGIFYRNAINLGLPVLAGDATGVAVDSPVTLDVDKALLYHRDGVIQLEPVPEFLLTLIHDGGLVPHLEKKFAKEDES
ncbi:MAG: 3-isopropylmalate dehydratase [Hyphomicrobiales bacterium]|nr:3-isopropylmalate dehydratase [Hyphomicrobiales bacterium]